MARSGTKRSFQSITLNVGFRTDQPSAGPRGSAQQRAILAGSELSGFGEVVPNCGRCSHDEKRCLQGCRTLSQSDRDCGTLVPMWKFYDAALALRAVRQTCVLRRLKSINALPITAATRRHFGKRFGNGFKESELAAGAVHLIMLPAVLLSVPINTIQVGRQATK